MNRSLASKLIMLGIFSFFAHPLMAGGIECAEDDPQLSSILSLGISNGQYKLLKRIDPDGRVLLGDDNDEINVSLTFKAERPQQNFEWKDVTSARGSVGRSGQKKTYALTRKNSQTYVYEELDNKNRVLFSKNLKCLVNNSGE